MMRTTRLRRSMVAGAMVILSVVAVRGHETTFKGTVETAEAARLFVRVIGEDGKVADKATWFAVTDATRVTRGDKVVPFADAKPMPKERVVVVVAHGDEAGIEWTCPMHSHIALDKAGQCPVCQMTLKERGRPARASQVKLAAH